MMLLAAQVLAQEADRMLAQGQADMAIVLDHLAAGRHRPQRHRGLVNLRHDLGFARRGGGEQRQRLVAQRLDRPERLAPRQPQRRPEGVGLGELYQAGGRHAGAAPEIVDRGEGLDRPGRRRWRRRRHWRGRAPCAGRAAPRTGHPSSVGSSVQSQREALTQTGRTSTPWSRASRTIWAGA